MYEKLPTSKLNRIKLWWLWNELQGLIIALSGNFLYILCAPWMVNIAHEIECSKGWKSRKRWGRARKLSKWQGGLEWSKHWSKPDCSVCTDEQKLHTEAIRSDEVPHAAEVQHLERGQYRNSRCSRHRHKDIRLTKRAEREENIQWIFLSDEPACREGDCTSYRLRSQQRS